MQFVIEHHTTYRFSAPVYLEPHVLRLTPRGDGTLRLRRHSLRISPEPQTISAFQDARNNPAHRLWFLGKTEQLEISILSEVVTLRENPFDFLASPLDVLQESQEWQALQPALERIFSEHTDVQAVRDLEESIPVVPKDDPMGFCIALCERLHETIEKVERFEPGVLPPSKLLETRQGACRDSAACFMDCCRGAGLPVRFVSGYYAPAVSPHDPLHPSEEGSSFNELHAWAEVYLPGGGWRGFDPTHGLVVADRHVPVAAAPHWDDAMPLTGSFRGSGESTMSHEVMVRELG